LSDADPAKVPVVPDGPEKDPDKDREEGRRLIRVGGTGISLADRLFERFHRLTWRTPIHGLHLRGRHPLKLVAAPDDPMLGDEAAGRALLDGLIRHRGEERGFDVLDFARPDWTPGFDEYLHSFAWLRDLSTVATRARGAPVAEMLTRRWLAAHAATVGGPAWAPDLWGRRVLFWTAHAPLILSSDDIVYRSSVLNALARGSRHLDRTADKAPAGHARIAACAGVVAAGLLLPGGEPRQAFGETGLARALGTGLFDDGGIVSRSPAALMDAVETLGFLAAAYDARGIDVPEAQRTAIGRMVSALLGVTHGDRGLSSWQGGGPVPAERVNLVVAASGVRTRPLRQARDWGYQRLAAGPAVAILDAAPPPVGRAVTGGCASTLAFEFSDGPVRLVVNCGGGRAATATLPATLTQALRTSAAHSTLVLADANSTAVLPDGTLGRGVTEVELSRQEIDGASRIEATHDGYVRRHGFAHRRQLMLLGGGSELRGEDQLLPRGRRAPAGPIPFTIRFHLGQGVEVAPIGSEAAVLSAASGACLWRVRVHGAVIAVEESLWIDPEGVPRPTRQLVLAGEAAPGGTTIAWILKRAR